MIDQGNSNVYGTDLKFGYGGNQMDAGVLPTYVPSAFIDSGGFNGLPVSRKRSRDSFVLDVDPSSFPNGQFVTQNVINDRKGIVTLLGDDVSMQICQQQLEIDRFISQHTEKMRSEIEAARRRISMILIAAADEGMKRLRSKEDEIVQIGRLNRALEEKIKSVSVDNQIWRQTAQSNEATANVLRRNLQQILTQIQERNHAGDDAGDVESCCGSNDNNNNEGVHRRTLDKTDVDRRRIVGGDDVEAYCGAKSGDKGSRWCRNCGKEELGVLLLPCRHLCVCTVCESSINVCPICKSTKNASLHVNMNSF